MESSKVLLCLNPEHYTAWNARKAVILASPLPGELFAGEMELTLACLRINPKSYTAWYHRRWCIQEIVVGKGLVSFDIRLELGLLNKLLDVDSRNFHCWNYRMWLTGEAFPESEAEELAHTWHRIQANFSNYSAWHHRARLLLKKKNAAMEYSTESAAVKSAAWTEPGDESVWWYWRWLVQQTSAWEVALGEVDDLLGVEPETKHALAMRSYILRNKQQ